MFDGLPSPFVLRSRGFNPATLFASGAELGFVLDLASDALSTRTPGTGVQTITTAVKGRVFSQGTTTARPTYQLDGSLPYLQFDGVDDWMTTSGGLSLTGSGRTIITAVRKTSDANIGSVIESRPAWTASGLFAHFAPSAAATANYGARWNTSSVQSILNSASSFAAPHTAVLTSTFATGSHIERVNGVQVGSGAPAGTLVNHTADVTIGARDGSSLFFTGRVYAMIVIDRVLTAGELAAAEAWAASKCGVTL